MKNEQKFNTANAKKVGLIAKDYPLFKQDLAKLEKILKKYLTLMQKYNIIYL